MSVPSAGDDVTLILPDTGPAIHVAAELPAGTYQLITRAVAVYGVNVRNTSASVAGTVGFFDSGKADTPQVLYLDLAGGVNQYLVMPNRGFLFSVGLTVQVVSTTVDIAVWFRYQ